MKVKSKISYLGERNSILPGQMAEQLAVEVNVKNVTYGAVQSSTEQHTGQALIFALDICIYLSVCHPLLISQV